VNFAGAVGLALKMTFLPAAALQARLDINIAGIRHHSPSIVPYLLSYRLPSPPPYRLQRDVWATVRV